MNTSSLPRASEPGGEADGIGRKGSENTVFCIIGAGWRAEFFLRIAAAIGGLEVAGVVTGNRQRAARVQQHWRVATFATIDALLETVQPDFAVVSVTDTATPAVTLELAERGLPALIETPPATDLDSLIALNRRVAELRARIQVAEQYWAQPLHAARLAIIDSGRLGPISQAHISVCHGYHGISLIRRYLGLGFDCPTIAARRFTSKIVAGPNREGPPASEKTVTVDLDHAWLDFGDHLGVYEFSLPQYRHWARGQRVCIRGERGEILDSAVTYLQDAQTPVKGQLLRYDTGHGGNLEGYHHKGIQYLDQWVYKNPLAPARLSDEEIALGHCLMKMSVFVNTGESFYSLAEASQDQYLALCCEQSIATGQRVQTTPQPWVPQTSR